MLLAFYPIGWILIVGLFGVTQVRFYDAHERVYHLWRPRNTPWMLARSAAEYSAMLRATVRPDPDPVVESRRRHYLFLVGAAILYLVVGFPLALWLR